MDIHPTAGNKHDYIKATVAFNMIDSVLGLHIFPRTNFDWYHRKVILDSIRVVLDIAEPSGQVAYLNHQVSLGLFQYIVSTYLDRASRRPHYAIVSKLFAAFFAPLPPTTHCQPLPVRQQTLDKTSHIVSTSLPSTIQTPNITQRRRTPVILLFINPLLQ